MKVPALLCVLMMNVASFGSGDGSPQKIDAIFAPLISAGEPGAAVLVVQDGKVVLQRSYGVAALASRRIDEHTNFRLASVTKQFTAMAIMLLVHDGKLRYQDHLTRIFPDFPAYGKTITIGSLLNHTSGLVDYETIMARPYGGDLPDTVPQIRDAGVLALLKQEKATSFVPGSHWSYSNSGYAVLAMVVEKISGQPFADFLRDRIFAPLGMSRTVGYEEGKNEVAGRAYGHGKEKSGWVRVDQSPTSAVLGDGGVYSSLSDLARWDRGLAQHSLLSAEEMTPATTPGKVPVVGPDGKPAAYGFGWFLDPYQGHRRIWHYGETVGFRTAIERFPEDRLTVIVLCNRNDIVAQDVALQVAGSFWGR